MSSPVIQFPVPSDDVTASMRAAVDASVQAALGRVGVRDAPSPDDAETTDIRADDMNADEGGAYPDPPAPDTSDPKAARAAIPKAVKARAMLDTNDLGLATRWEYYSKGEALYCSAIGWLSFDGTRFQAEDGEAAVTQNLLRQINKMKFDEYKALMTLAPTDAECAKGASEDERDYYLDMAKRVRSAAIGLGNHRKTKSVLAQASMRPKFLVKFDALDAAPGRLNTPEGVIDLPLTPPAETDSMRADERAYEAFATLSRAATDAAHKLTRVTRVTPPLKRPLSGVDPHPHWTAHLKKIMPDAGDRATLKRILGSCLVTHNEDNRWFVFQGRGGDGKSMTLSVVRHILGDYVRSADIATFLNDSRPSPGKPREDLMALAGGTRLVITAEPEVGAQLSTSTLKIMTGGEQVSARKGHKSQVEFDPQFKLIMMCNEPPRVKGDDDGTWRRPIMVRFPVRIPEQDKDPDIRTKLFSEAPQILAWMIDGYLDWWARGFQYEVSANIATATQNWRRESSLFAAWADDRVIWGRWYDRAQAQDLYPDLWTKMIRDRDEEAQTRFMADFMTTETRPPTYTPSQLYDDFCAWCEINGLEPWRKRTFSSKWVSKSRDMGVLKKRVRGENHYYGFDFIDATPRTPGSPGDYGDEPEF